MGSGEKTTQQSLEALAEGRDGSIKDCAAAEPGLLLVFSAGRPACVVVPLSAEPAELGRGRGALAQVEDSTLSRQHARVGYAGGEFQLTDLGSRNGSAVDGLPLHGSTVRSGGSVLRLGHSLFLLCDDLRPYRRFGVTRQGERVEGPALRHATVCIAQAAQVSRTLFITGESGTGKELLALSFHRAGPQRGGPFVPVNCATLVDGVAERLLFGAVPGAYRGGPIDGDGYLQAAHGGTLFLDELADLELSVQAKLLRVLETGAITPLGSTRPQPLQLRVCAATHQDLRRLVADGRFRADLFFRIGVPHLEVPPLRARREEVPWHIESAVARTGAALAVHSALVEACLLRPWPGNVRELLAEMNTAIIAALADGDGVLGMRHLSSAAGLALASFAAVAGETAPLPEDSEPQSVPSDESLSPELGPDGAPTQAAVLAAVETTHGNVSAAARILGMHRTQLRRRLAQYGWVAKKFG